MLNTTQNFPTLLEFLNLIDPDVTLDRTNISNEIALLSMVSAGQHMLSILTDIQQEKVKQILKGTGENTSGELLGFFESINAKPAYLAKMTEYINYWTIDFMLTMYRKASVGMRMQIVAMWPFLEESFNFGTE